MNMMNWSTYNGTAATLQPGNGLITSSSSAITLTLPISCPVGAVLGFENAGTGLVTLAQNASQTIRFGNQTTTAGTGGSIAATSQGDFLKIVCSASPNSYIVVGSQGNFTVV